MKYLKICFILLLCFTLLLGLVGCVNRPSTSSGPSPKTPFEILNIDPNQIDRIYLMSYDASNNYFIKDPEKVQAFVDYCKTFSLVYSGPHNSIGFSHSFTFYSGETDLGCIIPYGTMLYWNGDDYARVGGEADTPFDFSPYFEIYQNPFLIMLFIPSDIKKVGIVDGNTGEERYQNDLQKIADLRVYLWASLIKDAGENDSGDFLNVLNFYAADDTVLGKFSFSGTQLIIAGELYARAGDDADTPFDFEQFFP